MAQFIPAVLESDPAQVKLFIKELAQLVQRIQVDFADNTLVPNQTALPETLEPIGNVELDAHLMVDQPSRYFQALAGLGYKRVIVHVECKEAIPILTEQAQALSLTLALSINPDTNVERLQPFIGSVDFIQLMAIHPGFSNQPFLDSTYGRLKELKELYPKVRLAVDGGVRFATAPQLVESGAELLIVGKGGFILPSGLEDGVRQWQQFTAKL